MLRMRSKRAANAGCVAAGAAARRTGLAIRGAAPEVRPERCFVPAFARFKMRVRAEPLNDSSNFGACVSRLVVQLLPGLTLWFGGGARNDLGGKMDE